MLEFWEDMLERRVLVREVLVERDPAMFLMCGECYVDWWLEERIGGRDAFK